MGHRKITLVALLGVMLVGVAAWWASHHIESVVKDRTGQSLQAILSGTINAVNSWITERKTDAQSFAQNKTIIDLLDNQLSLKNGAESYISSPYHAAIESYLMPQVQTKGYKAYFLIDQNGVVISSSNTGAIGRTSFLTAKGDYVSQVFSGKTVLTPAMILTTEISDVSPEDDEPVGRHAVVIGPVRNPSGTVIAALALITDVTDILGRVTRISGFGRTAESFAFDRDGIMVTRSRFEDQLRRVGLLKAGQFSEGYTRLKDPGGNLIAGYRPDKSPADQPLTLIAAEAIKETSGLNTDGYRDYRGVMVVGAWAWNRSLGIGVATEVDKSSMLQLIDSLRNILLVVMLLTWLAAGFLISLIWRFHAKTSHLSQELQNALELKEKQEKQREETEKKLLESKEFLAKAQAVAHLGSFEWVMSEDSLVWSDEMYRIYGRNKEGNSILLQTALGATHPQDIGHLERSMKASEDEGVEFTLNHRIIRPNGQVRWLEVKAEVTRDDDGNPWKMVGTVRDITEEKATLEELNRYRDNLEQQVEERTQKLTRVNQQLEKEMWDREQAEIRIRDNEARLNALIKTAVEGIITIDDHSIIHTFNPAAEKMFGYPAQEVIGRNINMLMPEPIRSEHVGFVARYIQTREERIIGRTREVVGLNKNGRHTEIEISISVFKDGDRLMFTGILHDITERKKNEMELKRAKVAAEEANLAKSRFLANMSHEIRTPMNSVIGYLDLVLEDPGLNPDLRKNLRTASRSAGALLRLINDILDVSKLEAGKMELERMRFNLFRLLEDIRASFQAGFEKKGLYLEAKVNPQLSRCYLGDQERLRQVIINLLSNALKFTEKGGVSVSVDPVPNTGLLQFAVTDTGIGIPEDKLDLILEPFIQADVTTTRRFGGTGLGTTISRQIVELMNGSIWIDSEEGKGSTFYFTAELPISECSITCSSKCENFDAGEKSTETPFFMRAFHVLLAEDLQENAELARIRLERMGHQVTHVWNGREAVDTFKQGKFDIILMDVQMPEMDGLEATKLIRRIEAGLEYQIPIIALTASVMQEEKERCREAGMDYVIGKPVDFPILFNKMETAVPKGRGQVTILSGKGYMVDPKEQFGYLPGVDLEEGLRLWQDPDAYKWALKQFAKSHGGTADEIYVLLNVDDLETAYQRAHAIKGVAGNLRIDQVFALSKELCEAIKKKQVDSARKTLPFLSSAITEVVNGITGLSLLESDETEPEAEMDKNRVAELLSKLVTALAQDDPGVAEPVLENLKVFLSGDQLFEVTEALERFDFAGAIEETQRLAARLEIELNEG